MQVSHCDLTSFHKLPSQTVIFTCEGINLTVTLAPFVFVFFFKDQNLVDLGKGGEFHQMAYRKYGLLLTFDMGRALGCRMGEGLL